MTQVESKSGRRLLAVIMSVMMMLAFMPLLPGMSEMAYAQDTWDGTAATAYAGGSGTAGAPYQIATGEQLKLLANQVNAGTDLSGKYYKLTDDISLNDLAWTPIGGVSGENSSYIPSGNYFKGTFDGNGKTISGLSVSVNPTSTSNFCGWGLFGCSNGAIKNLTVSGNISIASTASRSPEYVGGIVGYTQSDVYNCHTNVTIDVSNASATYEGSNVGGIAGAIERTDTVP